MIYSYLSRGKRHEKNITPKFSLSADVLVVGVGTSGTYAALGAVRHGATVIAIEREMLAGGMYALGRVTGFYYGEVGGSYTLLENEAEDLDRSFFGGGKHAEARAAVMTEKLLESGVKLYTGATLIGVFIENNTVVGARALIRGEPTDIFCSVLIDATSDGHALRNCPVRTHFGRPTDGKTAPFTCWTTVEKDGALRGMNVDDGYCDQYDPFSFSDAVIRAHARKLNFIEDGSRIIAVAPIPGVREGISFEGEETLSYKNILAERDPQRILFYARSDLDKHGSDIALDEDEYQNYWCISNLATVAAVIPVPIGAIMPKDIRGIVTAGRCLCVDSYALGAVRMNRDMMRMGECVGILAALASAEGKDVRDVDYELFVSTANKAGCRLGKAPDKFAFDYPNGQKKELYRPVSFDMNDDEIISSLATDSPGVAIYSCRRSDGHIIPKLLPLLDSDDASLSLGAALALGIMGDARALPRLRRAVLERSSEIFTGCRRSNQFKSATAICLLARFGTTEDLDLLSEIVFDSKERDREMYLPKNTPVLAYSKNDVRFCYFQHFTHALSAMCKIALREGKREELLARLREAFDEDGIEELVDYVTLGVHDKPIGVSLLTALEYTKSRLS